MEEASLLVSAAKTYRHALFEKGKVRKMKVCLDAKKIRKYKKNVR